MARILWIIGILLLLPGAFLASNDLFHYADVNLVSAPFTWGMILMGLSVICLFFADRIRDRQHAEERAAEMMREQNN